MKGITEVIRGVLTLVDEFILEIIISMFLMLFLFWTVGYFANPLYGYHFDLSSCWGGFSAIGGAGILAIIKYLRGIADTDPLDMLRRNMSNGNQTGGSKCNA